MGVVQDYSFNLFIYSHITRQNSFRGKLNTHGHNSVPSSNIKQITWNCCFYTNNVNTLNKTKIIQLFHLFVLP